VIWPTVIAIAIYILTAKTNRPYRIWQWQKQQWHFLLKAIKIGWPTGLLIGEEIAFLFVFSFFMGKISISTLAANQIALQFIGFFTTLVWGIGQATSARVGNKIGEQSGTKAKLAGITGIQLSLAITLVIAIIFLFFPHAIIAIDFHQPHTQLSNEAAMFLRISSIYLILNTTRILANCALRAYKDTYFSLIVSLVILWIIAIPLGYFAAFHSSLGPIGFWIAAIIGELVGTMLLLNRFIWKKNDEPLLARH
ncbi:MAG: hypothetical protein CMF39_04445, partial [Legionellaceae bacterium]|nr:hypothetical protein [Legionellaceae bacterium]